MGHHPLIFTEIGIPYDLDDKYAYKTGDYSSQIRAMDANHFALEGSGANGYSVWTYMSQVSAEMPISDAGEEVLTGYVARIHMSGEISGTAKIFQYFPLMMSDFRLQCRTPRMSNHQRLETVTLLRFQRAEQLVKTPKWSQIHLDMSWSSRPDATPRPLLGTEPRKRISGLLPSSYMELLPILGLTCRTASFHYRWRRAFLLLRDRQPSFICLNSTTPAYIPKLQSAAESGRLNDKKSDRASSSS